MPGDAGAPFSFVDRHWRWWLAPVLARSSPAYMLCDRWGAIHGFALGDTDDNMRMMQVRGLLDGQGWYDLRQHRLTAGGPTSTGRGWSTCRSPALKLLLHAVLRRPDRRADRGRGRAAAADAGGDGGDGGDRRGG